MTTENTTKVDVEQFDTANDDTTTPWGWFGSAGVAIVVAVLCFTPVWEQVAPGDRSSGRRAGFSNLLHTLGPVWVAAIAGVFAVFFIVVGIQGLRADRKQSTENQ